MAGTGGTHRGRPALAATVALAVTVCAPGVVAADEPAPQILPGPAIGTVIADLDGDGVDDVARLTRDPQEELVLDVWRDDGDGWRLLDARGVPLPEGEVSGLVRWRHEGRDELLLIQARFDTSSQYGELCCLAAWRARVVGGRLELLPMELGGRSFEAVYPIDLDDDGTDELLITATRYEDMDDLGTTHIEILGWDGSTWLTSWQIELDAQGYGFSVGDTDGRTGSEVLIGPSAGELMRVSARDGEIVEERSLVDGAIGRESWAVGTANGDLVLVASNGVHLVRWPAEGAPSVVASARMSTYTSVQVVGDGPDALLILQTTDLPFGRQEPRVDVYDLTLSRIGSVPYEPSVLTAWRRGMITGGLWTDEGRPLFPYIGPIPGLGGYAAGGTLVRPDPSGGYAAEPMASLIGTPVVGVAGVDRAWAVLTGGYGSFGAALFLHAGFRAEVPGRLVLVPVEQLLGDRPELAGQVELRGAVETTPSQAGTMTVAADGQKGFTIVVTAQPGTAVAVFERFTRVHQVGEEPLHISVGPHRPGHEDLPFEREILIMSTTGHASLIRLEGTFIRSPPELSASAGTELFAARATVSGRASPGSTVSVDGRVVEAGRWGHFEAVVDAPIWPRTVLVTARDGLGNETTQRLEVIGVVDYRGLPWLPITAVLTLGAGAAMFLRTPRRRPLELLPDGDGRLEEVDGDEV